MGASCLKWAQRLDLEGIVAKRKIDPYLLETAAGETFLGDHRTSYRRIPE